MVKNAYYNLEKAKAVDVKFEEVPINQMPLNRQLKRRLDATAKMVDGTFVKETMQKNSFAMKGAALGLAIGFAYAAMKQKNKMHFSIGGILLGGFIGYVFSFVPESMMTSKNSINNNKDSKNESSK